MADYRFADVKTLCDQHDCVPAFRSETSGGRVWFSLAATEDKTNGKRLYDIRGDYPFEGSADASALFDQAMTTWFK